MSLGLGDHGSSLKMRPNRLMGEPKQQKQKSLRDNAMTPEIKTRAVIDKMPENAGYVIQDMKEFNLTASLFCEYHDKKSRSRKMFSFHRP